MDIAERQQRGAELVEKMMGPELAEQVRSGWREISPDFEKYVVEFLAGEVWSREGLDLRTKSLLTIVVAAAMGRTLALDLNIRMALRNGATKKEITEALLHIAPYAGFPATWEGLAQAHKVFQDVAGD